VYARDYLPIPVTNFQHGALVGLPDCGCAAGVQGPENHPARGVGRGETGVGGVEVHGVDLRGVAAKDVGWLCGGGGSGRGFGGGRCGGAG